MHATLTRSTAVSSAFDDVARALASDPVVDTWEPGEDDDDLEASLVAEEVRTERQNEAAQAITGLAAHGYVAAALALHANTSPLMNGDHPDRDAWRAEFTIDTVITGDVLTQRIGLVTPGAWRP
jgi:hypothetical protein